MKYKQSIGGLFYEINIEKKEAIVTGAAQTAKDIIIPMNVEYLNQKIPIKRIAPGAFKNNSNIQSLVFERSVIDLIPDDAFLFSSLTKIVISNKIVRIGKSAFKNCHYLKQLIILEGSQLIEIGENAFEKTIVENIIFPPTLKVIKKKAFYLCRNIQKIAFGENSQLQSIEDDAFSLKTENGLIDDVIKQENKKESIHQELRKQ